MNSYVNASKKNTLNHHFKKILSKIETNSLEVAPRGNKVKELYFEEMNIDPYYPIIDFPSRPFPFFYLLGEIGWYLSKDTSTEYINNFSSFWKNIEDPNGHVNSNYGNLLIGEQLFWVKTALIKDKNTRQAIAFLNKPDFQYPENKDFVCTMYLNFFIREDKLNMKMTIRSQDLFFGLSFDAPFFSFILQHMYLWLKKEAYPNLQLGDYYHFMDNSHYYERHYDVASKISNEFGTDYSFILKEPMFYVNENDIYIDLITPKAKQFIQEVLNLRKSGEKRRQKYIEKLQEFFTIEIKN